MTSADGLPAMAGESQAKGLDHVGGGEQAAVLGDELEEIGGQPLDLHLFEDGGDGVALLLGGEHRALHQAGEIVHGVERLREAVQIALDLIERVLLERKLEQRVGVPARNA